MSTMGWGQAAGASLACRDACQAAEGSGGQRLPSKILPMLLASVAVKGRVDAESFSG